MTVRENLAYLRYFGVRLTAWKTINTIVKRSRTKLAWKVRNMNNHVIEQYLKHVCHDTYTGFVRAGQTVRLPKDEVVQSNLSSGTVPKDSAIWTMWWQGEENAPELVRACIASMRRYSNGHPIIVVDASNIYQYIQLPESVMERYGEGKKDKGLLKKCVLDQTRLSDIVRCALLSHYGGLWCDATIFFTAPVPERLFTEEWSTLGQDDPWYVGGGKWSTFFMGCHAGNPLVEFVYRMHVEYFEKKKYCVNYLLIDYLIDMAYQEIPQIAEWIDHVQTKNKKCLTLNRRYREKVDEEEFDRFMTCQRFHKLSWKWWGRAKDTAVGLKTADGEQTWFGLLYERYIQGK